MVILTQDRRKIVSFTDGDVVTTESDKSGRVDLIHADHRTLIGEYSSGYVARAVIADLYACFGGSTKYLMPTMGQAKKLYSNGATVGSPVL